MVLSDDFDIIWHKDISAHENPKMFDSSFREYYSVTQICQLQFHVEYIHCLGSLSR